MRAIDGDEHERVAGVGGGIDGKDHAGFFQTTGTSDEDGFTFNTAFKTEPVEVDDPPAGQPSLEVEDSSDDKPYGGAAVGRLGRPH